MTEQEYKSLKPGYRIIFARATSFFWKNVVGIITEKSVFGSGWNVKLPKGTNKKGEQGNVFYDTIISIHDIEYTDILVPTIRKSHLPRWF